MKLFLALVLMSLSLTTAVTTHAANTSAPRETASQCLDKIQKALAMAPGANFTVDDGHSLDGTECRLDLRLSEIPLSITHHTYRRLTITPWGRTRYDDRELSGLTTLLNATLEDNSNGANGYRINKCDVRPALINLKFSRHQRFGWLETEHYDVQLHLRDGQIVGVQGDGYYAPVHCRF